MRVRAIGLALAMGFSPALAQGVTMEGVARSASLMRQIVDACAASFDIDRDLGERTVKAFTEAGEKGYGKQAFARALAAEFPRRAQEVRAAGSDRWCAEQRERVRDMGGAALFRN